jgi:hypothetical protein
VATISAANSFLNGLLVLVCFPVGDFGFGIFVFERSADWFPCEEEVTD